MHTSQHEQFDRLVQELQQVVPFRIRFKEDSWEMHLLNLIAVWFCPTFLTHYTTVIGSTIYFPDRSYILNNEPHAMRTLAHEAVHMLDAGKWSWPLFMTGYLFPQILAVGVFTFPFLGWWALLFLLFALPIPAPMRFYFESRGYAMDVLTAPPNQRDNILLAAIGHFSAWDYYKMFPFSQTVGEMIRHWVKKAESGQDKNLLKVLLVYELVAEN